MLTSRLRSSVQSVTLVFMPPIALSAVTVLKVCHVTPKRENARKSVLLDFMEMNANWVRDKSSSQVKDMVKASHISIPKLDSN